MSHQPQLYLLVAHRHLPCLDSFYRLHVTSLRYLGYEVADHPRSYASCPPLSASSAAALPESCSVSSLHGLASLSRSSKSTQTSFATFAATRFIRPHSNFSTSSTFSTNSSLSHTLA